MKVTRKVASRRLKRKCIECDKGFIKGNVYYLHRHVFSEDGKVYAYEHLVCARCTYKQKQHEQRFKDFKKKCEHPARFVYTEYSYWEPLYDKCILCSQKV